MKWPTISFAMLFLAILYFLSYEIERHQFPFLAICFSLLFVCYYTFCWSRLKLKLSHGLILAALARLMLLPAFPGLSDDVYRFLWDGLLTLNHVSPFAFSPEQLISNMPDYLGHDLYSALNSKPYYSVYPPLSQGLFTCAAYLSAGHIVWFTVIIKICVFLTEAGLIFFLLKLLEHHGIKRGNVLLYALNPLVIVEGMGNLHFEVFMAFFIVLALFFLIKEHWLLVAFFIACSIAIKMVSAILWPFLIPWLGFRRWLFYSMAIGIFILLLFLPLWKYEHFLNFTTSLDLYFRSFEFNASIYYVIRSIGSWFKGYNPIAVIGPILSIVSLFAILALTYLNKQKSLRANLTIFTLGFTIYLLFATTVHPWYIILPLTLSPLIATRFVLVWSSLIWMSYVAYGAGYVKESSLILCVEYFGLLIAIWMDREIIIPSLATNAIQFDDTRA